MSGEEARDVTVRTPNDERIKRALLEGHVLSEVQKRVCLDYQRSVGGDLADIAVRLGFLGEKELARCASNASPRVAVTEGNLARTLIARVPLKLLEGYRVVPVSLEGEAVLAAEDAEIEPIVLEELWSRLGTQIPVVQAEPGTVAAALQGLARAATPPAPTISLPGLVALLVRKGVITEDDLRSCAADARGQAAAFDR